MNLRPSGYEMEKSFKMRLSDIQYSALESRFSVKSQFGVKRFLVDFSDVVR